MAHSRMPGPLGIRSLQPAPPDNLPGPLGLDADGLYCDSPGPVGSNDWAEFGANGSLGPRTMAPASGGCACGRDLSLRELRRIYAHQSRKVCEIFLPFLNSTFRAYRIGSCLRKAHFLAQVAAESAELQFTREQVSKTVAQQRYQGYQGRGLIQLTFENNYRRYGTSVHHDFLADHRSDLEKPEWAADSAGWYWTAGSDQNLNALADRNDLLAITAHINGGFNGFDARRSHLKVALTVLKVTACPKSKVGAQAFRPYRDSLCHDSMVQSFAWGAWNDPAAKKHGVSPQLPEERRAGYARYLELRAAAKGKPAPQERHYGFTIGEMDQLAGAGAR